ncbi:MULTISPECIES: UDP-glucose 4-epimerase GalE [unclassified Pseudoclavibacter]|uniref:UDP-glucose 4-epimerase GalE n=1 Tax=unclassified Pseudoclavibacter TaxID=2615177 RepID=UPI00130167B2|nr:MULTISPECIES: UDP-glucose 4-epimerase GalE [unclassified Pseudoclavibacter]KAB1647556.1 UDP-glucose 4-epimerase GalE [Pseudoclavibacter sp. CFCC 14310]KAB1663189.1 UDP-glucose 4-epimerase GalE [Pseudoclavibacter sp. CFCC 13611]
MGTLITGGAGYIGAHVVRLLQERGEHVVVVDDLTTGAADRVGDATLHQFDISAAGANERLADIMREEQIDSVVHFAAKKQVGESVERPLWYYRQNLDGLNNVLQAMVDADAQNIVFSSSAAVYGEPDVAVVPEDVVCQPINPYGQTKFAGEWLIDAVARAHGIHVAKLRYFNVAGSGWDDLGDPAILNLVPMVFDRIAQGKAPLIFGDDYPTPDGTCVRDYIHVYDLADAHLSALAYLKGDDRPESTFNIGTGSGFSVRQVVDEILKVTGSDLVPEVRGRRAGDPPQLIADSSRVNQVLGWHASHDLSDIVTSAWQAWLVSHPGTEA